MQQDVRAWFWTIRLNIEDDNHFDASSVHICTLTVPHGPVILLATSGGRAHTFPQSCITDNSAQCTSFCWLLCAFSATCRTLPVFAVHTRAHTPVNGGPHDARSTVGCSRCGCLQVGVAAYRPRGSCSASIACWDACGDACHPCIQLARAGHQGAISTVQGQGLVL